MKKIILITLGLSWSMLAGAVVPYDPVMTQSANCQQLKIADSHLSQDINRAYLARSPNSLGTLVIKQKDLELHHHECFIN